jgi:hypothetical protein
MRAVFAAVALIAVIAATDGIRANGAGADPSGSPLKHGLAGTAASFDGTYRPLRARDNSLRVAQVLPDVAKAEETTGNPSLAPFKWSGLLIIPAPTTQSPNAAGLCTAQFIAPTVLITAGHCIKDITTNPTGPWPDPTKGTFWLQYQNDSGTSFNIVCAATNPLWSLPANYASLSAGAKNSALNAAFAHDFAMVLVDRPSPTGTMQYVLDWKGKYTRAFRIGYPGDIFDAAIIQKVPGIVFFADQIPLQDLASPNLVVQWGPITDATEGMSGGAWVANMDSNEGPANNILIAVTSFGAQTQKGSQKYPGGTFAAYLTAAEFNPLLASVSKGCK